MTLTKINLKVRFLWLLLVMLIGTNFLGLMPFAGFVNINTKPVVLIKIIIFLFFAIKTYNRRNKIDKILLFFWLAYLFNKFSSIICRNQSISDVIFQGYFIYDFGFFYIISYIRPTVNQVEKAISYLGISALVIYFVQYSVLPVPIVESLSEGWRTKDTIGDFDIQRFSITGEVVIFLYGLLSLNKYLIYKKKIYIIILLATFAFTILHGYRSLIFAYAIAFFYFFFKNNGFYINKKSVSFIILFIFLFFLINSTSLFDDILGTLVEKNEMQSSTSFKDLDRIVEFNYFYENIGKPFEWIFGAGFIGKNLTDSESFINWVDIGFIGLSFMGGILLTVCWLGLLLYGMKNRFTYYINSFCLFLILGTISFSVAFLDKSIVVQCLVLYLISIINNDKYYYLNLNNKVNLKRL